MGDHAPQADGVDVDPGRTDAARAPSTTSSVVGSGAQSGDAAAMRRAVIIAVPDGASALASWCSSMTSAVSKYGAASSAKRIISTAPMAKFGAIRQLLVVNAARSSATSSSVEAGRADDRVQPLLPAPGHVGPGGVEDGEVDGHLHLRGEHGARVVGDGDPRHRATGSAASDRGDQLEVRIGRDGRAPVVPMRPVAPNTPTRRGPLTVIAAPYPRALVATSRRPSP